jgi:uncharacterized protein YjeT (DUF2065 family)
MSALRTVMTVQGVVLLIYGLPMLLVPRYWTMLTQQAPLPENYILQAVGIAFVTLGYLEEMRSGVVQAEALEGVRQWGHRVAPAWEGWWCGGRGVRRRPRGRAA